MKKILILFRKILFINITFKKPEEKKLLIYDAPKGKKTQTFLSYFIKNNYNIFYNRYEQLNIYTFFFTIFKNGLKNLKKNYKVNFITFVNPRVIITYIDNNPGFYLLKNFFPSVKIIAIQNGLRDDLFYNYFKNFKNLKCDYLFVFSKYYKKFYNKIIKSNIKIIGSFSLNLINKRNNEKKDLLFISKITINPTGKITVLEFKIINFLIKFSKKKNMKLSIAIKRKDYVEYFKNSFEPDKFNKLKFIFNTTSKNNMNEMLDYKLIICTDSTMGYEALTLNKKVVFICDQKLNYFEDFKNLKIAKIRKFGDIAKIKKQGVSWTSKFSEKKLTRMINETLKMSKKKWLKLTNFLRSKDVIYQYDRGNKTLSKILNKESIKIRAYV